MDRLIKLYFVITNKTKCIICRSNHKRNYNQIVLLKLWYKGKFCFQYYGHILNSFDSITLKMQFIYKKRYCLYLTISTSSWFHFQEISKTKYFIFPLIWSYLSTFWWPNRGHHLRWEKEKKSSTDLQSFLIRYDFFSFRYNF